jgi:FkbM family methyltransferase
VDRVQQARADLIYDVGLHDGQDTAYYLSKGYRVVAVEANPELARAARNRFADEIGSGRLTVLNVAIAASSGETTFWISDDHTDWSSFDQAIAGRGGAPHHPIQVTLKPFREVLEENGLPRYCKIDIEGSEPLCLRALSPRYRPPFISVELTDHASLEQLADLGYDRFKVIDQYRFTTSRSTFYRVKGAMRRPRARAIVERLNADLLARRQDGEWKFGIGSSGPLPELTRGRWLSYGAARRLTEFLTGRQRSGSLRLHEWFDLHATDQTALGGLAGGSHPDGDVRERARRAPTHRPRARADR